MNLPVTLVLMLATVALLGLSIWQSGRKRKDSINARWVPWNLVTLLASAYGCCAREGLLQDLDGKRFR